MTRSRLREVNIKGVTCMVSSCLKVLLEYYVAMGHDVVARVLYNDVVARVLNKKDVLEI